MTIFQIELLVTDEKSSIDKFRSYYEFTIEEGMSVGSTVGRIGNGETFKFELLKKNDNFEIEEESGVIRIKNEVGVSVEVDNHNGVNSLKIC